MRIATWNCNSLRARLEYCLEWLGRDRPDVLLLQETKLDDPHFPILPLAAAGYQAAFFGQPTYNGVAILWRQELPASVESITRGLDDPDFDREARALAIRIGDLWFLDLYVPNGKSTSHPDFQRKLRFLARVRQVVAERWKPSDLLVVAGDFNVAPEDRDCHDPAAWRDHLLCHPLERQALASLLSWGLVDALRVRDERSGVYSWWDYRGGAFRFNHGLRIDLILVTRPLVERVERVEILREERKVKGEARWKPSDHAPVVATIAGSTV